MSLATYFPNELQNHVRSRFRLGSREVSIINILFIENIANITNAMCDVIYHTLYFTIKLLSVQDVAG